MDWLSMIILNRPTYPTLVKYFYSNFSFDRSACSILSFVKGKMIEFDYDVLDQILGMLSDNDRYFNITYWSHNRLGYRSCIRTIFDNDSLGQTSKPGTHLLSLKNRLIHHILTFNFLLRRGHRDNVSHMDIYLLTKILSGDRVNLPYVMINYMIECLEKFQTYLPYGAVLTVIFEAFDVRITNDDEVVEVRPTNTYDKSSLRRTGYIFFDDF